jgi:hypothetical protein
MREGEGGRGINDPLYAYMNKRKKSSFLKKTICYVTKIWLFLKY